MITHVDTSALLKLVVAEDGSERVAVIWDTADTLVSTSLVIVEGRAALAAARRGRRITGEQHRTARRELEDLIDQLALVEVTRDLVTTAADLAESEGLRGYDAVHLAAATIAGATVLCSADRDLCEAASRLGFHVANPLDP